MNCLPADDLNVISSLILLKLWKCHLYKLLLASVGFNVYFFSFQTDRGSEIIKYFTVWTPSRPSLINKVHFTTVNSEMFARILFSQISLKDKFATFKNCDFDMIMAKSFCHFARVLFSQNFTYAKFRENKTLAKISLFTVSVFWMLIMLAIFMHYTPPNFLCHLLSGFKLFACIYKQSGNNKYQKPADLDWHNKLLSKHNNIEQV